MEQTAIGHKFDNSIPVIDWSKSELHPFSKQPLPLKLIAGIIHSF